MENKVLEKNIDRIKQYDEKLADSILMANLEKSNIELFLTDKGEYNILYNGIPLHSQSGAIEESENIISLMTNNDDKNAIRIVYGFGLGYLVDEMAKCVKGKIIVFEPDINILKFVLSIANVDGFFKDNVMVCTDINTFSNHISSFVKSDSKMTLNILPSYRKIFEEGIDEIIKIAQKAKGKIKTRENTFMQRTPGAIKNTFMNLKYIFQNPCIDDFRDIYSGKTALCLSAGPSLRKNIDIIKNNRDKFILFAVNPTLKLLGEYDILPDFIVAVESVDISHQLNNIDSKHCYLITDAFSHNILYKTKTKKTIGYISSNNYLNYWVRNCLNIKGELLSQGTVSYTAFMSAVIMGFKKIILCGQDLAYTDGQCYAKGSQFEDLECIYDDEKKKYVIIARDFENYAKSFTNERVGIELGRKIAKDNIDFFNKNLFTVKDQHGKDVPTQTGYALFIDWFKKAADSILENNTDIKLINSSTDGAQIEGFENIALNDALIDDTSIEKIDLTSYKHEYDKSYALKKVSILQENFENFKKDLQEFNILNKKALKEIKIKKTLTPNIIKLLQKHENSLLKIFNYKNNSEIRNTIMLFLNKYVKIVDKDYYSDMNICEKTIENIIKVTDDIENNIKVFIKGLADSKPFIS